MTDQKQKEQDQSATVQKWLDDRKQEFLDAGFTEDDIEIVHGAIGTTAQQFGNIAEKMQMPPIFTYFAARLLADYFEDHIHENMTYTKDFLEMLKVNVEQEKLKHANDQK